MTAGRKRKRSKRYEAHEKKILKISLLTDVISPKSILSTTLKTSYKHNNTFFNSQDLETFQCPNGRLDKVSEPCSSLSKQRWEWGPTTVSDTESYNSPLSGKVRMLYKGVPSRHVSHIVGERSVKDSYPSKDSYFLNTTLILPVSQLHHIVKLSPTNEMRLSHCQCQA